ncbi:phage tail protein [Thalassospira alkalitolerans]
MKIELGFTGLAVLSAITFGSTMLSSSQPAHACDEEAYIGSICATAASYCPDGYFYADGRKVDIRQFNVLYAVIGQKYGGDGKTEFNLPNLSGRSVIGAGQAPGLSHISLGEMVGQETMTLTTFELPSHTHGAKFDPVTATNMLTIPAQPGNFSIDVKVGASTATGVDTTPSTTNNALSTVGGPGARIYGPGGGTDVALQGVSSTATGTPDLPKIEAQYDAVIGGAVTIGETGLGQAFDIRPPQLALIYCIAYDGTYPERP